MSKPNRTKLFPKRGSIRLLLKSPIKSRKRNSKFFDANGLSQMSRSIRLSRSWALGQCQRADLPIITLTNINCGKVAPDEHRTSVALKSAGPFSVGPNRVVDCVEVTIARIVKKRKRPPLERAFIPLLDGLPTGKHPVGGHQNPVLCEKPGHCGCVFVRECLALLRSEHTELIECLGIPNEITLLSYSWIDHVFLLGKARQGKADCQCYKGN